MSTIAGHTFDSFGRCDMCGRKWMDIRHVDESYVGEEGYAHAGKLNLFEVQQIRRKRAEEDQTFGLLINPQTTQSTQVATPPVIVDIVLWRDVTDTILNNV